MSIKKSILDKIVEFHTKVFVVPNQILMTKEEREKLQNDVVEEFKYIKILHPKLRHIKFIYGCKIKISKTGGYVLKRDGLTLDEILLESKEKKITSQQEDLTFKQVAPEFVQDDNGNMILSSVSLTNKS